MPKKRAIRIRELNDAFRRSFLGGRVVVTASIAALGDDRCATIFEVVRSFDSFDRDNDPHGEHDFGIITDGDERVYWKIDYYDAACVYGSEDPADPQKTTRVLTIMLAEDY